MKKQLEQVLAFHEKFNFGISDTPSLSKDRVNHRYDIMTEELHEYVEGVQKGDLPNVAKELADVMYTLLGTVIEHGLQEKFEDIFDEVHASNMSKSPGEYKATKGENYFKADMKKILDK